MTTRQVVVLAVMIVCLAGVTVAQQDEAPLKNWTAPPYWTPPAAVKEGGPELQMQVSAQGITAHAEALPSSPLSFTAITPCRVADTRAGSGFGGQYGPPSLSPGNRDFTITGQCGIPSEAVAVSFNFTIIDMTTGGDIRVFLAGGATPLVSTQNWVGTTGAVANAAVVPLGTGGAITVHLDGTGTIDLIIDVNGYYGPQSVVTSLTGGGSTLTGDVTLAQGSNIAITPSGNTLTIAMTGVPGGTLPAGASGQTLRSNGSAWLASSALTNDGTNVGITGNLLLPATTSGGAAGVLFLGTTSFLHNYGPAGASNTFVGTGAGNFTMGGTDPEGKYNTGSGSWSLSSNTTGSENTANGLASLNANTTGDDNTATGIASLWQNTTGSWNTANGAGSLKYNTTGFYNTASGSQSLFSNTTATRNTATGQGSMYSNTTGSRNTAIGMNSLVANTTANRNTALGEAALPAQAYDNGGTAWDTDNTAVGCWAMYSNNPDSASDGYRNTAVGSQSLYSNITGSNNIAVGYNAGYNLTTGNWNIDIGNQGVAAKGNTIRIGDINQTNTFIAGISGVTISGGSTVLIDSTGHLGSVSSSLRFKRDVAEMADASSRLMELRPVTFHYKTQADGPLQYGLIAEEVEQVIPELVVRDATGQPETVAYHELPAMLLNELQKQRATIQAQQAQIEALKTKLAEHDAQQGQIEQLATRLAALEDKGTAKR